MNIRKKQTQKGFSIIEILLAAAMMGVVSMATLTMIQNMLQETRSTHQKIDATELRNSLVTALNNPDVCSWQIKDLVMDLSQATTSAPSPTVVALPALYAGMNSLSLPLARVGEVIPMGVSGLKVASISLSKVFSTGIVDEYRGTISVNYAGESLVRPLRATQVQVGFSTKSGTPSGAKTIENCAQNIISKTYSVPVNLLHRYHSGVGANCQNMNSAKMNWDSACSRYCSKGCAAGVTNCLGNLPGKGFISGLANECSNSSNISQCLCVR